MYYKNNLPIIMSLRENLKEVSMLISSPLCRHNALCSIMLNYAGIICQGLPVGMYVLSMVKCFMYPENNLR